MESEKQIPINLGDPTPVATQFVLREVNSLKELTLKEIEGIKDAVKLAHDDYVRVPTVVEKEVAALKAVLKERIKGTIKIKRQKFAEINHRFTAMEQARLELKKDTADTLAATLKATNESTAKSELAFKEQMNQMLIILSEVRKNFEAQIFSLEKRLTMMESMKEGALSQRTESRSSSSYVWGIVAFIASIIFGLIGLYMGAMLNK